MALVVREARRTPAMPHIILKAEKLGDAAAEKQKEADKKIEETAPAADDTSKDENL